MSSRLGEPAPLVSPYSRSHGITAMASLMQNSNTLPDTLMASPEVLTFSKPGKVQEGEKH